jgi:hypothetical protein
MSQASYAYHLLAGLKDRLNVKALQSTPYKRWGIVYLGKIQRNLEKVLPKPMHESDTLQSITYTIFNEELQKHPDFVSNYNSSSAWRKQQN